MKIKCVVDQGSRIPSRAHSKDAGLDLYAKKGGWIFPKCKKIFGTGFHALIPAGYVGLLTSKSGMMFSIALSKTSKASLPVFSLTMSNASYTIF